MRLLLVEPDAQLAERLRDSLESDGYLVDLVETLADARKSVIGVEYAAVLMDLYDPVGPVRTASDRRARPEARADDPTALDVDLWFG